MSATTYNVYNAKANGETDLLESHISRRNAENAAAKHAKTLTGVHIECFNIDQGSRCFVNQDGTIDATAKFWK